MSKLEFDTHSVVEGTIGELRALPIDARIVAIKALTRALPALLEAAQGSQLISPVESTDDEPRLHLVQEPVDSTP